MAGGKGGKQAPKKGVEGGRSPAKRKTGAAEAGQPSILTFFGGTGDGTLAAKRRCRSGERGVEGKRNVNDDDVCIINEDGDCNWAHASGGSRPAARPALPAPRPTRPAQLDVCLVSDDSNLSGAAASDVTGLSGSYALDLDNDKLEEKPQARMQLQADSMSEAEASVDPHKILSRDYHPEADACWKRGEPTPFLHLARTFSAIDNQKGRYKLRTAVSNMFRSILRLSPQDTLAAVHLTTGKMTAGVDLNIGGAAVCEAIAEVSGVAKKKVGQAYTQLGDLGDVAASFRKSQQLLLQPMPLLVSTVFKTLLEIASEGGTGSGARRKGKMMHLLRGCREQETRYLVRTLIQHMRIGMNTTLVLGALAAAYLLEHPHTQRDTFAAAGGGDKGGGGGAEKVSGIKRAVGQSMTKKAQQGKKTSEQALEQELQKAAEAAALAYAACPNMNVLVSALLEGGIELMQKRCTVTPGTALKPMLAKVACGIADAVSKLRKKAEDPHAPLRLLCEYKYDGVRSMVHIRGPPSHAQEQGADTGGGGGGEGGGGARPVLIFSRNCEDKTNSFPDVVEMLQLLVGRRQMVLDAEIVAVDRSTRALLPFQQLSTRARVSASAVDDKQLRKEDVTVTVCVFLFDLLFLDDRPLLQEPLQERRRLLAQALPAVAKGEMPGVIEMARSVELCIPGVGGGTAACRNGGKAGGGAAGAKSGRGETDDALETEQERLKEEVRGQAALMEALDAQCEGLMMKDLDGGYHPGKRADCWLKVKKDYVEGLADSFDLVPIGAWHGSGRKAGWYSPFLMAVHDPETGELQSLCRVMSGFTDAFYKAATARLGAKTIATPPSYYVTGESPSVWFEADEVWEIRGAELTASPLHMAGGGRGGTGGRGLALRFPRFLSIREDKNVEDATNPEHVLSLFHKQSNRSAPPPQASAEGPAHLASFCSDDDQDDAAAAASDSDGSDDAAK